MNNIGSISILLSVRKVAKRFRKSRSKCTNSMYIYFETRVTDIPNIQAKIRSWKAFIMQCCQSVINESEFKKSMDDGNCYQ